MVTLIGKLIDIEGAIQLNATAEFMLSGYGSQIPRAIGASSSVGTFAKVLLDVDAASPFFSVELIGNDLIVPDTTFYTMTVRDGNGDVLQCNAYRFIDGNDYDLDFVQPFDPTLPLMPLPPSIINELLLVTATDTMIFDGSTHTAFKTVLHSNITHAAFAPMIPGNLYTFLIDQDGTGGWEFNWGATVHNGTMVKHNPNARTTQTFVADQDGQLYAISGGAYS